MSWRLRGRLGPSVRGERRGNRGRRGKKEDDGRTNRIVKWGRRGEGRNGRGRVENRERGRDSGVERVRRERERR